jgi:hypothetical protein
MSNQQQTTSTNAARESGTPMPPAPTHVVTNVSWVTYWQDRGWKPLAQEAERC